MTALYTFVLGVSVGLSAAFFAFGKFWLGIAAGIPIGMALFLVLVAILIGVVEMHEHLMDDGTGDGYRN